MSSEQYWDSCLFIRFLMDAPKGEKEQRQLDQVKHLAQEVEKGRINVIISTMVLAEIRPREPFNKKHFDILEDLFYRGRANPRVVGVTPPIARLASQLGSANKKLTSPDAVHVATAILEAADLMYTFDGDADSERRRSGKLLTYHRRLSHNGGPKLNIVVPPDPPIPDALQIEFWPDGAPK